MSKFKLRLLGYTVLALTLGSHVTIAGALLPSGYLSTNGNQIVSSSGTPVRLACTGIFDWTQGGNASIAQDMQGIAAAGFNCVRYPYYDATLSNTENVLDQMVSSAAQYGLKIIIDHHGNEASLDPAGSDEGAAQPCNGMWYDSGGPNPVAGCPNGNFTDAQVIQNLVTLAQRYVNNPSSSAPVVIGFDLQNEPLLEPSYYSSHPNGSTWAGSAGGNGSAATGSSGNPGTDIQSYYSRAAAAIEQVNPGVLIICEGVGNATSSLYNGGSNPGTGWDLTYALSHPVTTSVANKLVYSEHDYPAEIGGAYPNVSQRNTLYGFLITGNHYPVWIGEMGASLDGSTDGANESSQTAQSNEQAWANDLIAYLNGQQGSQGGPTFSGNQQGVSTDWWAWGHFSGEAPDGTLTNYGSPQSNNINTNQQTYYNQLAYTPISAPACSPVSANDYTVTTVGPTICDPAGNTWAINSSAQITQNGTVQTNTANVTEITLVNGNFWQENASNLWYEYQNGTYTAGTSTSPLPAAATTPTPPSTPGASGVCTLPTNISYMVDTAGLPVCDSAGNAWAFTKTGTITRNGAAFGYSANVIKIESVKGVIWQENASKLWWQNVNGTWTPPAGSASSPICN